MDNEWMIFVKSGPGLDFMISMLTITFADAISNVWLFFSYIYNLCLNRFLGQLYIVYAF